MQSTVIVVGSAGQDGSILCDMLARQDRRLIAISRSGWRTVGEARQAPLDILDRAAVARLVRDSECSEIYYLAAYHGSSEARNGSLAGEYLRNHEVQCVGLLNFLDAATLCTGVRLFYAASSRVFGTPDRSPQDESTPFRPDEPYGISKATGIGLCRAYRRHHGTFASVGILYNHESPRRPRQFVSKKIVEAAVAVKQGRQQDLVLDNLDARVDWSAAEDVAEAMTLILQLPEPDEFVVASGEAHTVRDFAELAFRLVGLDWHEHVRTGSSVVPSANGRVPIVGDASRLKRKTGWCPQISWEQMVEVMIESELARTAA